MMGLARRIGLADMAYIAVAARGASFYPKSFLAPFDENQPELDRSLDRVDGVLRDVERAGLPRRRIACVGFSQGACLASEYVLRHPARWGALIALTGGLIGPPGTAWTPSARLDGTPVLLATAESDSWVPLDRVMETAAVFRAMGAEVDLRVSPGGEHVMDDGAVAAAREILARLLVA